MVIVEATIENFKRIEVAHLTPGKQVVEITGANRAGKSSILDAIESALAGRRRHPGEPVRRGAEQARVVLRIGDLIVERVWKRGGPDRLVVRREDDGSTYPKAQAKLADLIGELSFDPMAFAEEPPAVQRETLLGLVGVDLDALEDRHRRSYDERRDAGRDLRSAEARLTGLPEAPEETPGEEISSSYIMGELRKAQETRLENDQKRREASRADSESDAAQQRLAEARRELAAAEAQVKAAAKKAAGLKASAAALIDPDVEELHGKLEAVDKTNRNVRAKKARSAVASEVDMLRGRVAAAQRELDAVAKEKADSLQSAQMPIDGLEITDAGVLYRGLPLDQASTSERIGVCTAIAAAVNPSLRIALVRGGNDLDDESLAAFYVACEAAGVQAWVERIRGSRPDAIEIVAGAVAGKSEGEESP